MASDECTTPPSKRGVIDTSLPYEHVSDAVSLFGARMDHSTPKQLKSAEKRESPTFGGLKELLNEAVVARAKAEADKLVIEQELIKLKTSYDELTRKVEEANKSKQREGQLKDVYDRTLAELEAARNTIEKMEADQAMAGDANSEELRSEVERLSKELQESEASRSGLARLTEELEKAKFDLLESKKSEQVTLEKLQCSGAEVEAARLKIKETEGERAALMATAEYLRGELDSSREELRKMMEIGGTAAESMEEKLRAKVEAGKVSNAKLSEAKCRVEEALERVFAETIEAEVVKRASAEWLETLRQEEKQTMASVEAAEKMALEKMGEAEKARRSEVEMLEKGGGEDVRRRLADMEEVTRRKIASVVADVEAVRASEAELNAKLAAARGEAEAARALAREAADRAAAAEAAKSAVEARLREQRRRHPTAAVPRPAVRNDDPTVTVQQGHVPPANRLVQVEQPQSLKVSENRHSSAESLAQMLQMVPEPAMENAAVVLVKKKKKKRLLARLSAIFLLRS